MLKNAVRLPDGTVAETVQDIDKYLKKSGSARSSDYSPEYLKNIHFLQSKQSHKQIMADFIHLFKKGIWYD